MMSSYIVAAIIGIVAIAALYFQDTKWEIHGLKEDLADLKQRVNEISSRPNEHLPLQKVKEKDDRPIALIAAKNIKENDAAHLYHVNEVFKRLGYRTILGLESFKESKLEFDVFWNHEYPFMNSETKPLVEKPKPNQIINHISGSGYYTSKVALATANLSMGVPLAFALPKQKAEFEAYAKNNPDIRWVQKSNAHRNIKVLPIDQLDTTKPETFIQKFVENPLLIDGKKFDVGIYTVITSVTPLKVYIFDGDALIRFCPKDYEPFDAEDVDRYVVGDDYTPIWEMPSLKSFFVNADLSFRESLNSYLKSVGKDPEEIWSQIREIIRRVFESQNQKMIDVARNYKSTKQFFELSRFDFVVDSNLKVFLMEANMSPNLSSGHFKQNRLLYEQVIFNVLSLIGAATTTHSFYDTSSNLESKEMQVSDKDLNHHFSECDDEVFDDCVTCAKNVSLVCELCKQCMSSELKEILQQTFLEHLNRKQMRRILPRSSVEEEKGEIELTRMDWVLSKWLEVKCKQNRHFCE